MVWEFQPIRFIERGISIMLDKKEGPRLMAMLLYQKFCPYPNSCATEAFFDGAIRLQCYVPSMAKRNVKRLQNETKKLGSSAKRKTKKMWGIFSSRGDAEKYFFLGIMRDYFKWTEKNVGVKKGEGMRNPRYITLAHNGQNKQIDFFNEVNNTSLEDFDTENNYPLYVIKKCFMMGKVEEELEDDYT